ncbi:MAG: MBL fold metallo-hydrolase, partial [Thermomicrobiales bacterium]
PYGPTAVMAYLFDGASPTLMDSGGARHPSAEIGDTLRERGIDLDAIGTLLHTHGHWDHSGGTAEIVAASGCEVVIHRAGVPLLRDVSAHLDGYATVAARSLGEDEVLAGQRATFGQLWGGPAEPDRLLGDGDEIDLGDGVSLTVLATPGHSDDHVAYWWEREGILIAGDAAQGTGSRPGSGPLYFSSVRDARASLAHLAAIPFGTLHVSHPFGRLGRDERATAFEAADGQAFLAESLATLDLIEDAFTAALAARPGESFPVVAREAAGRLVAGDRWPLRPDPTTGVPPNLAPTLHTLWREHGAGTPAHGA